MPEVSIIMPCYNAGNYLAMSIESIINQSFCDFELILINDGSTDDTDIIISSFTDKRIKYINNPGNLGLINSLNIGINVARGMFIARMDADDIAHSTRIETQIKFLKENPSYSIVGSYANIINSIGQIKCRKLTVPIEDKEIKTALFFQNSFIHPSILVKSEVIKRIKYSLNYEVAEDYFLWVKILENNKGYNLPIVLLDYRIHNTNTSSKYRSIQNESVLKIYTYLFDKLFVSFNPDFINAHFKLCIQNNAVLFNFEDYALVEKYTINLCKQIKAYRNEIDEVLFLKLVREKWINFTKYLIKTQLINYLDFFYAKNNKLLSVSYLVKLKILIYFFIVKMFPNNFIISRV
jgi:glycosyltransferase involved in cell wall biosynthesis